MMLSKLDKAMIKSGEITPEQISAAKAIVKEKKISYLAALFELEGLNKVTVIEILARDFKIPYLDIRPVKVEVDLLNMCPEQVCMKYRFIPVSMDSEAKELIVATDDPMNIEMLDALRFKYNLRIVPKFSPPNVLTAKIKDLCRLSNATVDLTLESEEFDTAPEINLDELIIGAKESPIVNLVNELIIQALEIGSSDIHIEAGEKSSVVRMRVDGLLRPVKTFSAKTHALVVSRIKIISRLNISNSRTPQDGRAHLKLEGKVYDMRISTLPALYGEKIVMRILDKSGLVVGLDQLGFEDASLKQITQSIKLPDGAVLVTGPTGSGKTTTLYSFLQTIKNETSSIVTVEDPVEYQIEGINHVPVNSKAGITFAAALRSILRQDPDVVMVGEIRDAETAQIAMHAAQTGHLVFSTLHTNDAPSTIIRLLELGVESSLLSSSLNLIVAQRLIRRLCPSCKQQASPDETMIKRFDIINGEKFFKSVGCDECMNSGYKGRLAIFEVLQLDERIRGLIAHEADSQALKQACRESGMLTLFENGFNKVIQGDTTLEELIRVASAPEVFSMREQLSDKEKILPLSQAKISGDLEKIEKAKQEQGQQTILIVDDSSDLRELVEMVLKLYGYKILQAEDGQQAWDMLQSFKPDLLLSDVEMPRMNGVELLQRVRGDSQFDDMPVVMLTSMKGEEDEVKSLNIGADDYIGKPLEPLKLQARVKKIMNLYARNRQK